MSSAAVSACRFSFRPANDQVGRAGGRLVRLRADFRAAGFLTCFKVMISVVERVKERVICRFFRRRRAVFVDLAAAAGADFLGVLGADSGTSHRNAGANRCLRREIRARQLESGNRCEAGCRRLVLAVCAFLLTEYSLGSEAEAGLAQAYYASAQGSDRAAKRDDRSQG